MAYRGRRKTYQLPVENVHCPHFIRIEPRQVLATSLEFKSFAMPTFLVLSVQVSVPVLPMVEFFVFVIRMDRSLVYRSPGLSALYRKFDKFVKNRDDLAIHTLECSPADAKEEVSEARRSLLLNSRVYSRPYHSELSSARAESCNVSDGSSSGIVSTPVRSSIKES